MARLRFFANIIARKSVVSRWAGQTSNLVGVASNPWWVRLPYSSAETRSACFGEMAHARHREDHNERAQGPRLRRGSSYSPAGQRVALAPRAPPSQYEGS
jgi:hypothetical protein